MTDAADKALHQQAEKHKTDLSRGDGVVVDDGQGTPPKVKADPYAARMAMFAKSDKLRAEGRARSGDDVVDTSHAPNPDQPTPSGQDRTLHLNRPTQPAVGEGKGTPAATPSQDANTRVTLDFNGGQIEVAQADIDRAGGKELYLRRRELDAEAIRLQTERTALEAERNAAFAETNRLREEIRAGSQRTGQDGPAGSVVDPTTQARNAPGTTGVNRDELATRLARQIYSGDEEDARKAISEIIDLASARGETLNADQIASRAAAMVREQAPNATTPTQQLPTVSPMVKAINDAINRMAQAEFSDVCNDEVARQATFAQLQRMMKEPANRDRRAVDIARDACEWGRQKFFNSREGIVEQKRGLPSSVAASSATSQVSEEPEVLQGSDYIAELNARRNFGRRPR